MSPLSSFLYATSTRCWTKFICPFLRDFTFGGKSEHLWPFVGLCLFIWTLSLDLWDSKDLHSMEMSCDYLPSRGHKHPLFHWAATHAHCYVGQGGGWGGWKGRWGCPEVCPASCSGAMAPEFFQSCWHFTPSFLNVGCCFLVVMSPQYFSPPLMFALSINILQLLSSGPPQFTRVWILLRNQVPITYTLIKWHVCKHILM